MIESRALPGHLGAWGPERPSHLRLTDTIGWSDYYPKRYEVSACDLAVGLRSPRGIVARRSEDVISTTRLN